MWKAVKGFPDYEVSDEGAVRSYRRKARKWRKPQSNKRDEPVLLTGTVTPLGYVAVILRESTGSKPVRKLVHRLVAEAFLPEPLAGQTDVCHNNGKPGDNRVSNLRWDTHKGNQEDMRKHGTTQAGEKSVTCKITAEIAMSIREKAAAIGRGAGVQLAKEYGLSTAQISRIVNNTRWSHL